MDQRFDIVVLDSTGKVLLGVGVSARATSGAHSAARWVRDVREAVFAGVRPEMQPAFLLATPDAFYFWQAGLSKTARDSLGDLATFEWSVESDNILKPYFARAGVTPGKAVDPHVFELIVWWWLGDVVAGIAEHQDSLERQGFYELLAGGRVELRAAA